MAELRRPPAIEAFGAHGFRIEGVRHERSVLILRDEVSSWSGDLTTESLAEVIATDRADLEFVILGVGPTMQPPPKALREAMSQAGIGLEVQTTPEAVRLYNLMAQQGRRVAAALVAV